MTKQRHLRSGDRLEDDATIVIRGGRLDSDGLRADALRYHGVYGGYRISVFAARDAAVDELAQQVPLVRFEVLTLMRVGVPACCGVPTRGYGPEPDAFHRRLRRSRRRHRGASRLRAPQLDQPVS